jgi:hypothetical protein
MLLRSLILTAALTISMGAPLLAQDAVTVGSVTTTSSTVDVPVYVRDVAGTPLGKDRDPSSHIQAYSIKVTYSPASAVASATFTRSGVTAGLSPSFESAPKTSDSVALLGTFPQATSPIPLVLDAPAPGTKVGNIRLVLSGTAVPGTTIALALDAGLTQLTDEGGTAATKETVANGRLALVDGMVEVEAAPLTLSLSPSSRTIGVDASLTMTVTTSAAVTAATTVTLTASSPSVSVPPSVVIASGSQQASFTATGNSEGSAIVTARLPAADGGDTDTATLTVTNTPACATPAAPAPSAPAHVRTGVLYSLSWTAVPNATEYTIEDAADASFAGAASTTTGATSMTFTRAAGTWFHRVRARNRIGGCDESSPWSAVISVVATDTPVAAMRIIPVVGSTRGNAGSFFKTSVQLYNPTTEGISGRIVFHPQGAAGGQAESVLAYSIAPGKTLSHDDLLPAMGLASGVGSADLVADIAGDESMPLPLAVVRIFNDAGSAGTTGLVQEAIRPEDALRSGDTGAIIAPDDFEKFRLNIGLRSLEDGASLTITVRDRDGIVVATLERAYGPHAFEQLGSAAFLGGHVLSGGETISLTLTQGNAIVYGSITDNITNDPAQQFARRLE